MNYIRAVEGAWSASSFRDFCVVIPNVTWDRIPFLIMPFDMNQNGLVHRVFPRGGVSASSRHPFYANAPSGARLLN